MFWLFEYVQCVTLQHADLINLICYYQSVNSNSQYLSYYYDANFKNQLTMFSTTIQFNPIKYSCFINYLSNQNLH